MQWVKYWRIYAAISVMVLSVGGYGLVKWGLSPGIDFTGGTLVQYQFSGEGKVEADKLGEVISGAGVKVQTVQEAGEGRVVVRMEVVDEGKAAELSGVIGEEVGEKPEQLALSTVGPAVGAELLTKTGYAILLAAGGILAWVALRFGSFSYGVAAIVAMFHDSLVLLGSFALLGHFAGVEVDGLFVTAVLTTLSFSVHDTIVVFDRIRELVRLERGVSLRELADRALTETMVRSVNNSLTIMFMLVALALLGGESVRWFVVALLVGTVAGTYSSPFVAVPLVILWNWAGRKRGGA